MSAMHFVCGIMAIIIGVSAIATKDLGNPRLVGVFLVSVGVVLVVAIR